MYSKLTDRAGIVGIIAHPNLQATKGGGTHSPKVFSMSHFLLLDQNFDVLGSYWGPFAHIWRYKLL